MIYWFWMNWHFPLQSFPGQKFGARSGYWKIKIYNGGYLSYSGDFKKWSGNYVFVALDFYYSRISVWHIFEQHRIFKTKWVLEHEKRTFFPRLFFGYFILLFKSKIWAISLKMLRFSRIDFFFLFMFQ